MVKNIIIDCDLMRHPASGLYYYCLNLGLEMHRLGLEEGKERIRLYVPPDEKPSFPGNAVIVERKWHSKYFRPFLAGCDLWHATFQSGRLMPRYNPSMKILLTVHDLNVLHEDKPVREKEESLRRTQKLVDGSDALVCISEHSRNDVLKHLRTGDKQIFVIHNGTHYVADPPSCPAAYLPERPFIFSLGYVNRKKNFHTLLALLRDPGLELVIAGRLDEPDYVLSLRKQAESMGVSERLKLLGPVSDADKAWYYRNSEAFVFPSLAEGFGAPVVEAMSLGKPVFLSDRTSLPEIGGKAAFYFRNFEAGHMYEVFRSGMEKFRREDMGPEVQAWSRRYSWKQKAREYLNVYRALTA